MLLTGSHLRALDALLASVAAGQQEHVARDEDTLRVLELEALVHRGLDRNYALTDQGREAARLLNRMREHGLLPRSDQVEPTWRFLGSEVLAALAAAERAGEQVGPLTADLLQTRGLAQVSRDPERKTRSLHLTSYGTAWLDFARRTRPHIEVTGDLANSIHALPPAYADPHRLGIPPGHATQLEALRFIVWSVPDRTVFTFTALGQAVYTALRMGGYPIADIVLDDAILTLLATIAEKGAGALQPEQLARVQMLGYAGADGSLTPAGEAALLARRHRDTTPSRPPATFTINRHEAELLDSVRRLSERNEPTTKDALHTMFVDDLERRFQAFVGKYGRKIREVPARKRQEEEMLAEMRDRDRAFGSLAVLDEWLVHLESFDLLHGQGEGNVTVYRLTPHGLRVVEMQGATPHTITGMAVKAIEITKVASDFYALAAAWVDRAREEELIGPSGITQAGRFYAWLAEHAKRWPALTRREAQTLLDLPQVTQPSTVDEESGQANILDRLEARGLVERLVDGQVVRTELGDLLAKAVAGALELAYPVTPAIVRLLLAVRQVGESLYVKEEKVRIPPKQWDEVQRLTGLGPDEFQETVQLARLGNYLGKANLTEAGKEVLEVLAKGSAGA
ncbi:MAG TPA: DUF505 domain-containing protein [Ktedonobacterales bacterium]